MPQSNILLITSSQHRFDAFGSLGWGASPATPYLDQLIANGIRFTNCTTTSPAGMPARVSLATGLYPHNTGVWTDSQYEIPLTMNTWMRNIHSAGYRTSFFGLAEWYPHQGDLREQEDMLHSYGFDDVNETANPRSLSRCDCNLTGVWEAEALLDMFRDDMLERLSEDPNVIRKSPIGLEHFYDRYIGQCAKGYLEHFDLDQPWFCWISFPGPHDPWDTPDPYASIHPPSAFPEPIAPVPQVDRSPQGLHDALQPIDFAPREIERLRADYMGNITLIDDQIGEILDTVEARGELDRTVIVYTSDCGKMVGDHGLLYKGCFFESALRVPLVVCPPCSLSVPGGTCNHSMVEWMDIGPTLAEWAGAPVDYPQFAKSLAGVIASPDRPHRSEGIVEYAGEYAVRDNDWKAVINQSGQVYRLFNLVDDPTEQHDLSADERYDDVCDRIRIRLFERIAQSQWMR